MSIEQKVFKLLVKWGHNEQTATQLIDENLKIAISCYPEAKPSHYAKFVQSVS